MDKDNEAASNSYRLTLWNKAVEMMEEKMFYNSCHFF